MRHSPVPSCALCPRLAAFRQNNQAEFDGWHNAPVPSFGPANATFLIVGLAPGLRGANRTGRPFTGDYAGDLLYPTLLRYGFARGTFGASPDDGLELVDCRITNAVRCVPPANKPIGAEINACRRFLEDELTSPNASGPKPPSIILTLGGIAHKLHASSARPQDQDPSVRPQRLLSPGSRAHLGIELPLLPLQCEHGAPDRHHVRRGDRTHQTGAGPQGFLTRSLAKFFLPSPLGSTAPASICLSETPPFYSFAVVSPTSSRT